MKREELLALIAAHKLAPLASNPNQKVIDFCLDWAERLLLRAEEREHPEWKLVDKPGQSNDAARP
jgi:hypothetical protein